MNLSPSAITALETGIRKLANLAATDKSSEAEALAQQLQQQLSGQASSDTTQDEKAPPPPQQEPRVEKCPRCLIRSLRSQNQERRWSPAGSAQTLYRCTSCGFEQWRDEE